MIEDRLILRHMDTQCTKRLRQRLAETSRLCAGSKSGRAVHERDRAVIRVGRREKGIACVLQMPGLFRAVPYKERTDPQCAALAQRTGELRTSSSHLGQSQAFALAPYFICKHPCAYRLICLIEGPAERKPLGFFRAKLVHRTVFLNGSAPTRRSIDRLHIRVA